MNKPITVTRPWWRNPIFPWGWRSISQDHVEPDRDGCVRIDGFRRPGGAGEGDSFRIVGDASLPDDSGGIIIPPPG